MKHIDRHELFSIPNLMGYFRILMIPVFCFLYLTAETKQDIWKAAAVVLISSLTDTLDVLLIKEGYLAVMGLILLMMTVMAVTLVLYIPVFEKGAATLQNPKVKNLVIKPCRTISFEYVEKTE